MSAECLQNTPVRLNIPAQLHAYVLVSMTGSNEVVGPEVTAREDVDDSEATVFIPRVTQTIKVSLASLPGTVYQNDLSVNRVNAPWFILSYMRKETKSD